ncbi:MAG: hypothetical protein KKA65_02205 [Nanoarchaeota archaeon]|nr:hypothetical protein [Nanoarchaeota archaeon]MBU4351485.1 hypothetical protein [Nanoarchaeota archaeon]MBU4456289.1 hypothetical protein [Nanoarchaeota archaeon]MCG2720139.1 hypothetical protein [Nanoarchaeota archaeon]
MSLFQCDRCGCLENTALTECSSDYMKIFIKESKELKEYKKELGLNENQEFGNYCSACCPLGERKWHGEFPRIFLPKGEFETAPNGNIRPKKILDEDVEKYALKIE